MSEELKPCPFCGGAGKLCPADYVTDDLRDLPVVECCQCGAWVPAAAWNARTELAALKAGQGEAVGTLHISHFRQNPEMENVDFQMTADLPPGSYKLYTAPPATADAVSVPRELLESLLERYDAHAMIRATMPRIEELRALLAQSQEVKS